jgi:general nucleoside transport system permease protein
MDFWTQVLDSGTRLLIPILLAALGELVSQRAGVMNIGLEGYMTAGAYAGFLTMVATGSLPLAVIAAVTAGAVVSLLMVAAAVWGRANQVLAGFAIFIMAPALVGYLFVQLSDGPVTAQPLRSLAVPLLHEIPLIGPALFDQNAFWYLAIAIGLVVWVVLGRTRLGLAIDACGNDPEIATSKGINVPRTRTCAVLVAGAMGGLGGAALTVGALGSFTTGVVNGRGFVAIAVVILAGWRLGRVFVAAAVIGICDALRLRASDVVDIPVQLLAALPWIVVLTMLVVAARMHSTMPRALGKSEEVAA